MISEAIERIRAMLQASKEGKQAIAEAITSKGVPCYPNDRWEDLAINVGLIEGGGGKAIGKKVYETTFTLTSDYTSTSSSTVKTFSAAESALIYNAIDTNQGTDNLWFYMIEYTGETPAVHRSFINQLGICRNKGYFAFLTSFGLYKDNSDVPLINAIGNNYGIFAQTPFSASQIKFAARCSTAYQTRMYAGEYKVTFYQAENKIFDFFE